jgi:hypothetical protein
MSSVSIRISPMSGVEVVADGADDQAGFLVDQEGAALGLGGAVDGGPQLQQVVEVPLQFFGPRPMPAVRAIRLMPLRHVQLVHDVAQFGAVVALDAARDAAAARVVRHQHQVAAGQRDEGGQRRALVAALVLVDLDDEFLAFAEGVLDACLAGPRRPA